jgi:tetratricopeptide (TPR) repeat protein
MENKNYLNLLISFLIFLSLFFNLEISMGFSPSGTGKPLVGFSSQDEKIIFQSIQMAGVAVEKKNLETPFPPPEEWYRRGGGDFDGGFYSNAAVKAWVAIMKGKKNSTIGKSEILLARALLFLGLYSQVIQRLEGISLGPSQVLESSRKGLLAEAFYKKGEYSRAISVFQKGSGVSVYPVASDEWMYLLGMSYFHKGDYLKAIETLKRIDPKNDRYPFALYSIALAYRKSGNFSSAVSWIRRIGEISPTPYMKGLYFQDWSHLILGELLLETDPQGARVSFEAIPENSPFFKRTLYGLAWSYFKSQEYVKSIVLFRQLSERFPDSFEALEGLVTIGYCYANLSAYEKAVSHYRTLLDKITLAIQKIEVDLEWLGENEKDIILGKVLLKMDGGLLPMDSLFDYSIVERQRIIKELGDLRKLMSSPEGKFEGEKKGPLHRIEDSLKRDWVHTYREDLIQRKRALEELLVRSSLGIARNLSPRDLGVKRQ